MPMVPEAAVAMLACARIGAIHSVIFGGFSPEAVAGRIVDSNSKLVITADEGVRAGRGIPLKKNVDEALKNPNVKSQQRRGPQTYRRQNRLAGRPRPVVERPD
jgi:acetyl-CoA synthetase